MTPCIESKYAPNKFGYCRVRYGTGSGRKPRVFHHRLVFALYHGLDPYTFEGVVMHACDNPRCINIEHLSLGTHKANTLDMLKKGRCTSARLTPDDVTYLREHFEPGKGAAAYWAARYNVSRNHIYKVLRGEQHSWIQL